MATASELPRGKPDGHNGTQALSRSLSPGTVVEGDETMVGDGQRGECSEPDSGGHVLHRRKEAWHRRPSPDGRADGGDADAIGLGEADERAVELELVLIKYLLEPAANYPRKSSNVLVDFARIEFGVTYRAGKPLNICTRQRRWIRYAICRQALRCLPTPPPRRRVSGDRHRIGHGAAIVHRHGGRAESSVGQGATFFFDFDGVQNIAASYQASSAA